MPKGTKPPRWTINPFLTWLAGAKTSTYAPKLLADAERTGAAALDLTRRRAIAPAAAPDIHRIERWWPGTATGFLARLKAAIASLATSAKVLDLLQVAFCRTLIKLSSAAFNHQSKSFKDTKTSAQGQLQMALDASAVFADDLQFVLRGAGDNPSGVTTIVQGDARDLSQVAQGAFDLVVTSPPYANRMSYMRELRPYMYWLGYLVNARDAGELDWQAIGGTWGVATSRLGGWAARAAHWRPDELAGVVARIGADDNANGALLAAYVSKYCEDMSRHFQSVRTVLKPGARVHYVVGNSTFYGVLVPTERLYAAMLRKYGFEDVVVRPIRKRNSKKALIEFDVSAVWPGG